MIRLRLPTLLLLGLSLPALAQRPPPPRGPLPVPPAARAAPAKEKEKEKDKGKPADASKDGKDAKGKAVTPQKSCEEVRRKARFGVYFDKVELEKLVQTVSDATCKTFILPENVRGKISIIGPENGKVDVDADQFYAAFLAALDSNGLTV